MGTVGLLLLIPLADGARSPDPLPEGPYASRQRVASVAEMRPRRKLARVFTTSLVLHFVRHVNGEILVGTRYCAVRQTPLGNVRTEIGPGFVSAIPEWESRARVTGPPEGPWEVEIETETVLLGAELSDPETDQLPDDASDHRVIDADADGNPGVTVTVSGMFGGQVYLVQRLVRGLRGTLTADWRMDGLVTGRSEQEVVGASSMILSIFTPRFRPDLDEERSTFDWVPVPGVRSCEELIAAESQLFEAP